MSDRETCVARLAMILSDISLANGYALDLGSPVSRNLTTIEELNDADFDTLIVEDNGDGSQEQIERVSDQMAKVIFSVPVIGYVRRASADPSVTTAINRLDRALTRALGQLSVQKIDGVWLLAKAKPLLGRSGSENGDYGWFIRPIEMHYHTALNQGI